MDSTLIDLVSTGQVQTEVVCQSEKASFRNQVGQPTSDHTRLALFYFIFLSLFRLSNALLRDESGRVSGELKSIKAAVLPPLPARLLRIC